MNSAQVDNEGALRTDLVLMTTQAAIVIEDQATYDQASLFLLRVVQPWRKRWKEYWSPLKESAFKAHKEVCKKYDEGDAPAEQLESAIKREIRNWDEKQVRLEQARQRAAQEAAEEKERADRAAQAFFAEEAGVPAEQVEAITSAPILAVAEPVAPSYKRVSGISTRDNWVARVTDIKKLCLAVAKGQVSVEYVLPNQQALDKRAKADKTTLNIPGVVPYNNKVIAGRSQ